MKTYPMKCSIRAESGEATRVDVYDDIGEDPWFGGGISAAAFMDKLSGLRGPLDVHISSAGGMVDQGLAIYNALAAYPGPVTTYNDGLAASVASVIMQAGSRRVMSPVSALMIHDAWGDPGPGNAADMAAMASALDKNSDILARAYAQRAGGTVQHWREKMQATTWYDADEALAAGLVDEIAGGSQKPAPIDLDAVAASAPGRIMARLRAAAAAAPDGEDDAGQCPTCKGTGKIRDGHVACPDCKGTGKVPADGDGAQDKGQRARNADGDASGGQVCKTCDGRGRLLHPVTGHKSVNCPSCNGSGVYDPDNDGDDDSTAAGDTDHDYVLPDGSPGPKAAGSRLRAEAAEFQPQPYHRDPDETVECPCCHLFNDTDAKFCDQCGAKLAGRDDVRVLPAAAGAPGGDALTEERVRAILREEVAAAAARLPVLAADKVDDSPWDSSRAWHNGAQASDPEAFYRGICAGHHTSGDPKTQGYWALPYRYSPDSPPNAGGVRSAWGVLNGAMGGVQDLADRDAVEATVKGLMKQVNPDWSPDDKSDTSVFAADAAGRYRAALKGARA